MTGAALISTIVSLTAASIGLDEVMGFRRSLQHHPKETPWFYGIYTGILIFGSVVVTSNHFNLVNLNVVVEVMNALLLPIVLGFIFISSYCTTGEISFKK